MSEGSGTPQRFCPGCGAQARPDTSFCVSCGGRIEEGGPIEQGAPPRLGVPDAGRKTLLSQKEVRLVSLAVGALLFLALSYLLLSFSVFLGFLMLVLVVLAVLVLRKNQGSQTVPEQRLFGAVGLYGRSARKAYEEGRHRELAQNAYQRSRRAYEGANARYQERAEKQAAERERDEALRKVGRERSERRVRFEQYRRFFERAHEGSRKALDWWRAYDTGEFDSDGPPISALLLSARSCAERGVGRLREMEGTLSNILEREEFEKADLLLDGVRSGQEDFGGDESVFIPLVAVHERIKQSEDWGNYRQQLERYVKDLEDLLQSPNVRTAAANRVRFPDPNRAHQSGPGTPIVPDQHSPGSPGSKICRSCGAENITQAGFCHNCGFNLRPVDVRTASTNTGSVAAGYVIAFLPLLLLPIVFTPAGVGLGIFNVTQGQSGHGAAQIAIACFTGILGALIGGAGLGI